MPPLPRLPLFHVLAFPLGEETLLCNSTVCINQMCLREAVCMHKLKDKICEIAECKSPGWSWSAQVIWSVRLGTWEVKERSHSNHWAEVDPECYIRTPGVENQWWARFTFRQLYKVPVGMQERATPESMKSPCQDSFIVFTSRAIWSWSQCLSWN